MKVLELEGALPIAVGASIRIEEYSVASRYFDPESKEEAPPAMALTDLTTGVRYIAERALRRAFGETYAPALARPLGAPRATYDGVVRGCAVILRPAPQGAVTVLAIDEGPTGPYR